MTVLREIMTSCSACVAVLLTFAPILPAAENTASEASRDLLVPPGIAGRWELSTELNRRLGFQDRSETIRREGGVMPAPIVEITIDKKLGDSLEDNDVESYREYVTSQGAHELVASGQWRTGNNEGWNFKSETVVTHRRGRTYVWFGTNVGLLPARVSFVPGASDEQDLMFIDYKPLRDEHPANRRSNSVGAYRRASR